VAGKRHFSARREDPNLCRMLGSLRRQHEGRLGQVELGCDCLHLPRGQFSSVGHNGERIAAELPISEHIEGDEFHLHGALQLAWVMCGRRRLGKNFLTFVQHWSGAVMCPACLCGGEAAGHNALRGSGPNR
jgi:hypothetical protein